MAHDFGIIDIGTNAVKCKIFADGKYYTPKNKFLSNVGSNNLNKDEVIQYISEFLDLATEQGIDKKQIYIVATEAFRRSTNKKEIKDEITKKLGKRVHIISPKREAWFSVLGGLSSIRLKGERPRHVLYVESGGGSTEISLVDSSGKNIRLISSVSIPIGSKLHKIENDDNKTKQLINQKISELLKSAQDKKIELDPSLRVVVNSTTASRIISRQYNRKHHNPAMTSKNQDKMGLGRFIFSCQNILKNHDTNQIMQDYWLKDEVLEGFIGHTYILNHVLDSIKKQTKAPFMSKVPITTTIGGLKDGIMEEIIRSDEKDSQKIEKNLFTIGEKNKEDDQKQPLSENKTKEDNQEQLLSEDKTETKSKDDSRQTSKIDEKSESKDWIDEYDEFYKQRNSNYVCEKDKQNNTFSVSDSHHKILYSQSKHVEITNDEQSSDNKIYEDMIKLAKEKGIEDIKFDKDVSLETKLRIYAACKKHGMKMKNFIYNPKMLENVSPKTKKIVLSSIRNQRNINITQRSR